MTKICISSPPPDPDIPEGRPRPFLRYVAVIVVTILAASATIVLYYGIGAFDVIRATIVAQFR